MFRVSIRRNTEKYNEGVIQVLCSEIGDSIRLSFEKARCTVSTSQEMLVYVVTSKKDEDESDSLVISVLSDDPLEFARTAWEEILAEFTHQVKSDLNDCDVETAGIKINFSDMNHNGVFVVI